MGSADDMPLARRAQLAVLAHIRHAYTSYDRLLRQYPWQTARIMVQQPTLEKCVEWRGEQDAEDFNAVEDILREVIVISEDEDEDENDGEENDADERMAGFLGHGQYSIPRRDPAREERDRAYHRQTWAKAKDSVRNPDHSWTQIRQGIGGSGLFNVPHTMEHLSDIEGSRPSDATNTKERIGDISRLRPLGFSSTKGYVSSVRMSHPSHILSTEEYVNDIEGSRPSSIPYMQGYVHNTGRSYASKAPFMEGHANNIIQSGPPNRSFLVEQILDVGSPHASKITHHNKEELVSTDRHGVAFNTRGHVPRQLSLDQSIVNLSRDRVLPSIETPQRPSRFQDNEMMVITSSPLQSPTHPHSNMHFNTREVLPATKRQLPTINDSPRSRKRVPQEIDVVVNGSIGHQSFSNRQAHTGRSYTEYVDRQNYNMTSKPPYDYSRGDIFPLDSRHRQEQNVVYVPTTSHTQILLSPLRAARAAYHEEPAINRYNSSSYRERVRSLEREQVPVKTDIVRVAASRGHFPETRRERRALPLDAGFDTLPLASNHDNTRRMDDRHLPYGGSTRVDGTEASREPRRIPEPGPALRRMYDTHTGREVFLIDS